MNKIENIHGDVTLTEVKSIPLGAKKIKWQKGFVLERGEGIHTHVIEDKCEIYEKDGIMYLKNDTPIKINHEEHGVQIIDPGIHRKNIERVFDYEEMEDRNVQD